VNIAVVVTGGVAETVLATPLVETLRSGDPDVRLTLLCPAVASPIAECLEHVDEVVPLAALDGAVGVDGAARVWFQLRRRRLDAAVLCTTSPGVTAAAYLAGCPQRVSPATGLLRLLLTASAPALPRENRARTWLRMAAPLGIRDEHHRPAFEPGEEARKRADMLLRSGLLADGRLLIAVAPGAGFDTAGAGGGPAWPPERYAHLSNQLAARHGAVIALVGPAADRAAVEQTKLDLAADAMDLAGATDLPTIAAVLARCDLLVGSDATLLHLAAGVGTPTVGLFGPRDGVSLGPYGADHRVVQALPQAASEGRHEMTTPGSLEQIRVEDVLASIESTF
jgi:ADP-heptose:LPS heptosyltransferase